MTPEQTAVYTYKDLDITFATGFSRALDYTDLLGLAGVRSVVFGRPEPVDPDGQGTFSALGDMLYGGYVNGMLPTGVTVAMVRPHPGSDGSAVAAPVRYETLWGCLWKPVPPHGYVALGMLSALGLKAVSPNPPQGLTPPPLDAVVCVREDLAAPAVADKSWVFEEFALWPIVPEPPDSGEINFSPATVLVSAPSAGVQAHSLRLAVAETAPELPEPPEIKAQGSWPLAGVDSVQATARLPFFAVTDPTFSAFLEQMLANPTYTFVREDRYTLIPDCGIYNDTGASQSPSIVAHAGYSEQQTTEFSETTGIEFALKFGSSDSPVSFSAKLSQSFTWSHTFGTTISYDYTLDVPIAVPPHTTVAAYWISSTFKLVRGDGSSVGSPVTANIPVGICYRSYPPTDKG
jgi:hypothetical protein